MNIRISLPIVAQTICQHQGRYRPEDRKACLWLANLCANTQRIQLAWQRRFLPDPIGTIGQSIGAEDIAPRLGLHSIEITRALTGHPEADLPAFTNAVLRFREKFEAALPPMVETRDSLTVRAALSAACREHIIATVEGKWRHGKTEEAEHWWLRNLDHVVWITCPSDGAERTFLDEIGSSLGCSTCGGKKKPAQLRGQIKRALGIGLIDLFIIDEAHDLWPRNLVDAKPVRAEFVRRELRDNLGVGSCLLVTEQFALNLELSKRNNARYAPGQLAGRRDQFRLHDAHTDDELRRIANLHAGRIEEPAIEGLLAFAKADEGYLGIMVIAIQRARREADARKPGSAITPGDVARATKAEAVSERVAALIQGATPKRRGRFVVVEGRAA